jgi:hypothetical protein
MTTVVIQTQFSEDIKYSDIDSLPQQQAGYDTSAIVLQ